MKQENTAWKLLKAQHVARAYSGAGALGWIQLLMLSDFSESRSNGSLTKHSVKESFRKTSRSFVWKVKSLPQKRSVSAQPVEVLRWRWERRGLTIPRTRRRKLWSDPWHSCSKGPSTWEVFLTPKTEGGVWALELGERSWKLGRSYGIGVLKHLLHRRRLNLVRESQSL